MLLPLVALPFVAVMSALVVAQQGPLALVGFYVLFTLVQGISAAVAVRLLDEHPDQLLMVPLYRLIYEPLRAYLLYRTAYLAVRGVPLGWDKLQRSGALNPRTAEPEPVLAGPRGAVVTRAADDRVAPGARTAEAARRPPDRGRATWRGGRDQYVDGLRAFALVRVVTYHTFGWIWLPVLFPSMAVMFALAGSLVAASLARTPGGHWRMLRKRVRRLLPPLWLFGAVLVALMIRQGWDVTRSEGGRLDAHTALAWLVPLEQPGGSAWGQSFVLPLWYIRTYLWLLLLSPSMYWLFRRYPRLVLATPLALLGVLELVSSR